MMESLYDLRCTLKVIKMCQNSQNSIGDLKIKVLLKCKRQIR